MNAANFDPRFLPGAVLGGRFRIERMLGKGGMGAVYGALHLSLGQYVAIKVLQGEAARDPDSIARFRQEAQIASRLVSPHIVRVHDLGQTEVGEPFIVMELLTGRDLDSVIADHRSLAVADAVHFIAEASIGVAAAHAAGLVHRDLKPANLFLARQADGSEIVKVLDFGLSKVVTPGNVGLTQSASSFGTPQYMAPEQIMSAKYVDARCDQHGLALILYELLAKKPAYSAETPGALTVKIVTQKPPSVRALRPDVPAKLDEVLQRALAKKPQDRFPDLGSFVRALAPFGGPEVAAAAETIQRGLRASQLSVAASAVFPAGSEFPSESSAPTEGSFSSGRLRKGKSNPATFWILAGLAVFLAIGATALLFLVRAEVVARRTAAASAEPSSRSSDDVPAAVESTARPAMATPTARPAAAPSAAPVSATTGDASAAAPSASASSPAPTGARPTARPPATTPRPHGSSKDPFDVFGQTH